MNTTFVNTTFVNTTFVNTTFVNKTFVNTTFKSTTFVSMTYSHVNRKIFEEIGTELKYFNPQNNCSKPLRSYGRIQDPEKTYPGSRGPKAPDPGSGSATLLSGTSPDTKLIISDPDPQNENKEFRIRILAPDPKFLIFILRIMMNFFTF